MAIRDRIRKVKHLQNKYFICVLENPTNITNIASAIRNISAFGVEKLYIVGKHQLFKSFEESRESNRLRNLSVGANKWVFVKHFETSKECLAHLRKNLYTVAVTSPHEKGKNNVNLYEGDFTQRRLAVWFGSEAKGITDEAVAESDMCIQIRMGGIVESLNLGTSTGIVLSYIANERLKYVYEKGKVRIKSKGLKKLKMRSWEDFVEKK